MGGFNFTFYIVLTLIKPSDQLQVALHQDIESISKAQTCNFICKSKVRISQKT